MTHTQNLIKVVEITKVLLGGVRRNLVQVMVNLNILQESDIWSGYKSFQQYAEEELELSQSMTSKLLRAHDAWIVKAGIEPKRLEGLDYEKLYGYIPLLENKDPNLALEEVKSWSRSDIKDEKQEKHPCKHENIARCCTDCWTVIHD